MKKNVNDLFFIIPVDLLSGINMGTISHESKIDWLEVGLGCVKHLFYASHRSRQGTF